MHKHHVAQLPGRHTEVGAASQTERCQRQRRWLAQVDALYGDIRRWLSPYLHDGRMNVTVSSTSILEQFLGRPMRRSMVIRFVGRKVVLQPLAPLLPGERGRIELAGPRGKAQLTPADGSAGCRWKIAFWDGSQTVQVELDEDTFLQAVLEATSD